MLAEGDPLGRIFYRRVQCGPCVADRQRGKLKDKDMAMDMRGVSLNEGDRVGDVLEENEVVTLTQNVTAG